MLGERVMAQFVLTRLTANVAACQRSTALGAIFGSALGEKVKTSSQATRIITRPSGRRTAFAFSRTQITVPSLRTQMCANLCEAND
jgi:hypothetical protein